MTRCRPASALTLLSLVLLGVAGCGGGSGSGLSVPAVAPARTFSLAGFEPSGSARAGQPTTIAFTVRQPDGSPLTRFKTGRGPHTGVHLIIVRDDLAYIIHKHPPIGRDGLLRQSVTLPAPGRYRVLVDIYPNIPGGQPNFQLLRTLTVAGRYRPQALPAFRAEETIDGYHIDMQGHPALHAVQAAFVNLRITDAQGHAVTFMPWFGALAHAIFFHQGSLDYFHTHVCGAGATNCTSVLGAARIAGRATAPGRLTLGVLLPVSGTWRLFLQMKLGGQVVTAPYTLKVSG